MVQINKRIKEEKEAERREEKGMDKERRGCKERGDTKELWSSQNRTAGWMRTP